MGFLFSKLFWGFFLVCWGVILIVEKLARVNIPLGRFFIAFLLIYFGIYILTRYNKPKKVTHDAKHNFTQVHISDSKDNEFANIFGSNVFDLSGAEYTNKTIEVSTVFGSSELYLSSTKTYNLKLNTVFGSVTLPNQKVFNIGTGNYIIGDENQSEVITIDLNTVFGTTVVKLKDTRNASENE